MATATQVRPWQDAILSQLEDSLPDDADLGADEHSHLAVWRDDETGEAELLGSAATLARAAELVTTRGSDQMSGESSVIETADLLMWRQSQNEPKVDEKTGQAQAFDRSQYDKPGMQIEKIDGQTVDKIAIRFGGRVMLDRSDPKDVALFNRLKLGLPVELRVAGSVGTHTGGKATNRDGDLDVIVGTKGIKIDTVYVLVAEELAA